jgi:hypothetical protein
MIDSLKRGWKVCLPWLQAMQTNPALCLSPDLNGTCISVTRYVK